MQTITRKRIEILADAPLRRLVTDAIDEAGILGWSIISLAGGKGHHGEWKEDSLIVTDKTLIVTIAPEAKAHALAERLAPLLTSHKMLFSMWDVEVIRDEHF
ncbi:MAG: P-II family nitrogen regulator [Erythrobacter sp.]